MTGRAVKLVGPKGTVGHGITGLVDERGVFVMMMRETDVKYYRFSGEADVIAQLQDERDNAESRAKALTDKACKLERRVGELEKRAEERTSESQKRRSAVSNAATKVVKLIPKGPKRDKAIEILADAEITVHKSAR